MTGIEVLAIANSLLALGQKLVTENREATEEEVAASFKARDTAMSELEAAIARARAREAAGE